MHIAIIGTGIAGMTAAYRLSQDHDVTVFESNDYIGGHTNTVLVPGPDGSTPVDTGFIVFNEHTYPGFCALLEELDVASQESEMSFSVRDDSSNLEYCGSTLTSMFAQRRNLLRPWFYRMIADILDFNQKATAFLENETGASESAGDQITLGEFLESNGWRTDFINRYIVPMGAAIWSMQPRDMFAFPAQYFLRFFRNHGLLQVRDRPPWRTVTGGSAQYVERLTARYRKSVRLNCPVSQVTRQGASVSIESTAGTEIFDAVVIATHSDQALRLIDSPTPVEQAVLGAMPYQLNEAVLHTDTSLLPRRRRAWASWNYRVDQERNEKATLTYNLNILQKLPIDQTYCVTLNQTSDIDPSRVIETIRYEHPVYSTESVQAQQRYDEINGEGRIYYCGAYWRNGFHEDGLQSGLRACEQLTQDYEDGKLHLRRVG